MLKDFNIPNFIIFFLILINFYNLGKIQKQENFVIDELEFKTQYKIDTITKNIFLFQKQFSGKVFSKKRTVLKSTIQGIIEEIQNEGKQIKKGEIIIKLNTNEAEIKLKAAQEKYNYHLDEFNNAKILLEKKIISHGEYNKIETELSQAEGKMKEAEFFYSSHLIKAPYDCIVAVHKQTIGSLINQQVELVEIYALESCEIVVEIPQKILKEINLEKTVFEVLAPFARQANFVAIENFINQNTQSKLIKLSLENFKASVNENYIVNITYSKKSSTLLAPIESVFYIQEIPYIIKLEKLPNKNYIAIKSKVNLGNKNNRYYEVLEGIKENDIVLCNNQFSIYEGQEISSQEIY